jgi:probable HAF family extracellular repeat protein
MSKPLAAHIAGRLALALAGFASLVASAAPAPDWTITALPSLPSPIPFAVAEGVNARGDIVGWSYVYDPAINSNRGYAVLWRNGVLQNLGEGSAFAVNDRGTIAGSVVGGMSLWRNGTWEHTGLGGAPNGINKFEAVAGWALGGLNHAYFYRDGLLLDLGTLGGSDSAATALNDKNQVVGYAKTANGNDHAFLWQGGTMRDLGTLPGGDVSRAHDINNHGVVVGESWTPGPGDSKAFIDDGTMRQLFPTAECCVVARAINDHGVVTGTIGGTRSFQYDGGVLTILETLPAVRAGGWTQLIPFDINDRGWIVGQGRIGAEWKAFILKPK